MVTFDRMNRYSFEAESNIMVKKVSRLFQTPEKISLLTPCELKNIIYCLQGLFSPQSRCLGLAKK